MHSKPDTPILPLLQHSIFLLHSLLSHDANLSNIHLATDLIMSGVPITSFWYSCGEDILAPRRQAIIHKIRNPKPEIRNKPKEFNANCEIRNELVWNFVLF